jgi:predicted PurR-regulated permease PerM
VIGGLIAFGVISLFIGPVVLAMAHTLLAAWVSESDPSGEQTQSENSFIVPAAAGGPSDAS